MLQVAEKEQRNDESKGNNADPSNGGRVTLDIKSQSKDDDDGLETKADLQQGSTSKKATPRVSRAAVVPTEEPNAHPSSKTPRVAAAGKSGPVEESKASPPMCSSQISVAVDDVTPTKAKESSAVVTVNPLAADDGPVSPERIGSSDSSSEMGDSVASSDRRV